MTKNSLIRQLYETVNPIAPRLPYHNMSHMIDVTRVCMRYAKAEGLGTYETLVLKAAGMLHDAVYVIGKNDNEERSAGVAREILPQLNYTGEALDVSQMMDKFVEDVSRVIMATKFPTNPRDTLEMVICDADLDNIGRVDFLDKAETIRHESGIDSEMWYRELLPKFLDGVVYYTESAQRLRGQGLQKNKERVGRLYEK